MQIRVSLRDFPFRVTRGDRNQMAQLLQYCWTRARLVFRERCVKVACACASACLCFLECGAREEGGAGDYVISRSLNRKNVCVTFTIPSKSHLFRCADGCYRSLVWRCVLHTANAVPRYTCTTTHGRGRLGRWRSHKILEKLWSHYITTSLPHGLNFLTEEIRVL